LEGGDGIGHKGLKVGNMWKVSEEGRRDARDELVMVDKVGVIEVRQVVSQ
jgi:hypothetical protein